MQLDQIRIALRPRTAYEAIDLGFMLARAYIRQFYKIWLVLIAPLFIAVQFFEPWLAWLAPLIIWWLKPWYDRVALIFYSRTIFGEQVTVKQTWSLLPGLFRSGLFAALTYRRFDLARSFTLPVWQLEGLRGKARRARATLMSKKNRGKAVWLTIVCVHMESALTIAMISLMYWMAPEPVKADVLKMTFVGSEAPLWYGILTNLFYCAAISIIEPFYVAAGFMLYLNRRVHLEGWDIEVAFSQLAKAEMEKAGRAAA